MTGRIAEGKKQEEEDQEEEEEEEDEEEEEEEQQLSGRRSFSWILAAKRQRRTRILRSLIASHTVHEQTGEE